MRANTCVSRPRSVARRLEPHDLVRARHSECFRAGTARSRRSTRCRRRCPRQGPQLRRCCQTGTPDQNHTRRFRYCNAPRAHSRPIHTPGLPGSHWWRRSRQDPHQHRRRSAHRRARCTRRHPQCTSRCCTRRSRGTSRPLDACDHRTCTRRYHRRNRRRAATRTTTPFSWMTDHDTGKAPALNNRARSRAITIRTRRPRRHRTRSCRSDHRRFRSRRCPRASRRPRASSRRPTAPPNRTDPARPYWTL